LDKGSTTGAMAKERRRVVFGDFSGIILRKKRRNVKREKEGS
jgi:hypothetical protein